MKLRKCKQCGSEVTDIRARQSFEEFDTVLCKDCSAAWLAKITRSQESPDPEAQAAQEEEAQAIRDPDILFYLYEDGPGGPVYAAPDPGIPGPIPTPPGAIFTGFIRPHRRGPSYQLFKLPYKLPYEVPPLHDPGPTGISQDAQAALRLGGFIFPDQQQ